MTGAITSPGDLARAVRVTADTGSHLLPVMIWVHAGTGAAVFITKPDAPWPSGVIKRCRRRPTLLILGADAGDDTDPMPADWRCLAKLRAWLSGAAVMIHAAGGEAAHYRLACRKAEVLRRVAVVECTPRTARAWAEVLACPDALLIWPRDGVHPVVQDRGTAH